MKKPSRKTLKKLARELETAAVNVQMAEPEEFYDRWLTDACKNWLAAIAANTMRDGK